MKAPFYLRRVVGHSMQPTLNPDQVVLASGWLSIRPNDLVIAHLERLEVIKRVKSVKNGQISLISDNQAHGYYGQVQTQDVMGRVIKVIPVVTGVASSPEPGAQ